MADEAKPEELPPKAETVRLEGACQRQAARGARALVGGEAVRAAARAR